MARIGIVGIGFMGMIHYLASERVAGAKVVAICSRDPKKLAGDWTSIQGNFGPRGTQMDLSGLARYTSFEELLADPQVDMVDLCVPNDAHASMAIQALKAGKHVLVEETDRLDDRRADPWSPPPMPPASLSMVGHVLPFVPEFAFALEAFRPGTLRAHSGRPSDRVISKLDWSSDFADSTRSGGPAIDLHIHDTHFVGLICGVPRRSTHKGSSKRGRSSTA